MGVPPDNPEYQKAYKLITAVRQQTMMAQKRIAQQQRAQQMQPGGAQDTGALSMGAPVSAIGVANGGPVTAGQPSPSIVKDSPVTSEQMALLRLQIQAFKNLAKNMPLTNDLKNQLARAQINAKESTGAKQSPALKALTPMARAESAGAPSTSATAPAEAVKINTYTSFDDPYSMFRTTIGYTEHSRRSAVSRPQIPAIIPLGLDVTKLLETRENVLHNRLSTRLNEISNMHANIGEWKANGINGTEDEAIKRRLLIEYHKLKLYEKQKAMRRALSREMLNADNLAMTANRSLYRRRKKQNPLESRITEKLEQQQRDARESKEKKKQTDFLASVVTQAEKLKLSANNTQLRYARFGRAVAIQHQFLEREEQKRIERTAKQRLQALKANDEETYLKLLGQAKDTRISHLLRQTDGFLKQLADSVKDQQRTAMKKFGVDLPDLSEESEADSEAEDGARRQKVDYYEVAHRIKETVTEQAPMLVGGTLKDYQVKGLQWMISLYNNNLNGILADEMGLGKTIQTISLITYLIDKKNEPGPFLVVVPLSTLTNWVSEFEKWAPSVVKIVYKGPPNQRRQHQQQIRWGNFQVLLTTYEFIIKDRPILSKIKWVHMIVDEGHRMKNANSKLSSTITQYYTTRYRLILTGTPLQNNLPELWALLNFVLPTIFKSVKSFDEWFNTPFANTGGGDKMELTEEEQLLVIKRLHKVLRPFLLRRLKKDVESDLPDKQERVIKCGFSALQAKLYKQLVTHNRMMISDGKGGKTGMRGLSNMLMQLRKLCNHPFVFEEVEDQVNPLRQTNDLLWRTAGKFELLDRVMPKFQATGHRVLMFFQMTQIMNIMEDFLRLRGMKYLRLDGSTKADDRSELLKLFNAPNSEYFCFLLSTRAGGLGLNLQTADTVIIYDSDWNPHQDLQAQDRAHRIGQKNEVRILRLITSNSVEEKILERANYKLDMDGKVIQAGKFDNKSTNEERDAMLKAMLETAETVEAAMENEEMDDDDLNMLMMRHDHELPIFQKMDADRERDSPYGPGKKYPRLMSEAELPDIYLQEDDVVEEVIEEITGRGARERKTLKYDDGLTEEQWLDAVDDDDAAGALEAAIARKHDKASRRSAKKAGGMESPLPSRASSESPAPTKKRGRKPKAEKRKLDDISVNGDDGPAPPKKRGRPSNMNKIKETLSPEHRKDIQKIMDNVHDELLDMKDESGTYELANPFIDLVPKSDYPEYYLMIKNPICLNDIGDRVNKHYYQSLKQFRSDIALMVQNCRTFNEEGSQLVVDVVKLEVCSLRLCEVVGIGLTFHVGESC